jgi:FkbM family methyltransferase
MRPVVTLVRDDDVVLDVGANIGLWSRQILAQRTPSALFAFEPAPRVFELLRSNLGPYPCATAERLALGGHNGSAELSDDRVSGQNHIVTASLPAAQSLPVAIATLDHWVAERKLSRVDVLKIDVEGLETEVISGAIATLRRCAPVVYFEYIPGRRNIVELTPGAFEMLADLDYEMHAVRNDGSTVHVRDTAACDRLSNFSHDVVALPAHRKHELPENAQQQH